MSLGRPARLFPLARFSPLALALFVPAATVATGAGCSGTSGTETLAPITGVTIRAEALTAGLGCGLADTQVFKYAAVVLGRNPGNLEAFDVVVAGNVYDCFTDGTFVELPASAGRTDYLIEVYAFNQTAYQAAGGDSRLRGLATDRGALRSAAPTFSTTCTAEQLQLVQSLAVCKALSAGASAVAAP